MLAGFKMARTCIALCFIAAPLLSATTAGAQSQWRIAGSPRIQEYCEAAFEAYRGQLPVDDVSLDYRLAGAIDAIESVRSGKVDFAVIERDLTEEERAVSSDKGGDSGKLHSYEVFRWAIVMYVPRSLRIGAVSAEQAQGLLNGDIADWSGLGLGKKPVLRVYPKYPARGAAWFVHRCGVSNAVDAPGACLRDEDVAGRVAEFGNAIGMRMVPFMEQTKIVGDTTVLSISQKGSNYFPTKENVALGRYPNVVKVVAVVNPQGSKAGRDFIAYLQSKKCAETFKERWLPASDVLEFESNARLREMKSGKGTRVAALGIDSGRTAMPYLATEYVRAKAVVQLSHAAVDADVSSVGAFITGNTGTRELLVLADKPSERAMRVHGEKWRALGRDADGKPNGAGPAEHVIAGRAVAIVVNAASPLEALTVQQVADIFAGKIEDWKVLNAKAGSFGLRLGAAAARQPENRGDRHRGGPPVDVRRAALAATAPCDSASAFICVHPC